MAFSSIIKKVALGLAQYEIAKTIDVVDNKVDIIFTRLDAHLKLAKTLVPSAITSTFGGVNVGQLEFVVMPVVPSDLPVVESGYAHETFDTLKGEISVMGTPKLARVTLDDYLLPNNPAKYPFSRPYGSPADQVVNFLTMAQNQYIPLRMIIVYHTGGVYLNLPCLVESISVTRDAVNDMHLNVSLVEYVELYKGAQAPKGVVSK